MTLLEARRLASRIDEKYMFWNRVLEVVIKGATELAITEAEPEEITGEGGEIEKKVIKKQLPNYSIDELITKLDELNAERAVVETAISKFEATATFDVDLASLEGK